MTKLARTNSVIATAWGNIRVIAAQRKPHIERAPYPMHTTLWLCHMDWTWGYGFSPRSAYLNYEYIRKGRTK